MRFLRVLGSTLVSLSVIAAVVWAVGGFSDTAVTNVPETGSQASQSTPITSSTSPVINIDAYPQSATVPTSIPKSGVAIDSTGIVLTPITVSRAVSENSAIRSASKSNVPGLTFVQAVEADMTDVGNGPHDFVNGQPTDGSVSDLPV